MENKTETNSRSHEEIVANIKAVLKTHVAPAVAAALERAASPAEPAVAPALLPCHAPLLPLARVQPTSKIHWNASFSDSLASRRASGRCR